MSKANWSKVTRRRHKKVLKATKGHRASRSRVYKVATESKLHAESYASIHRRLKKRQERSLAIIRVNAAARLLGTNYSNLMHALKLRSIEIDRKSLAEMAVNRPEAFRAIAEQAGIAAESN